MQNELGREFSELGRIGQEQLGSRLVRVILTYPFRELQPYVKIQPWLGRLNNPHIGYSYAVNGAPPGGSFG